MRLNITAIINCISTANNPLQFVFLLGYNRFKIPRVIRKLVAKSSTHRAWLCGYTGSDIAKIEERQKLKSDNFDETIPY